MTYPSIFLQEVHNYGLLIAPSLLTPPPAIALSRARDQGLEEPEGWGGLARITREVVTPGGQEPEVGLVG